jgi:phage head maturation protease
VTPGAVVSFWQRAGTVDVPGKGEFQERFAPGAFDSEIGKVVPLSAEGRVLGECEILSADVAEDGSGVMFTYRILGDLS